MISKEISFHGLSVLVKYTPPSTRPVSTVQIDPPEGGELLIDDVSVDDRMEWGNWYWEQPGDLKLLLSENDTAAYLRENCLNGLWREVLREAC